MQFSKTIALRVSQETLDKLILIADEDNRKYTALARLAIEDLIDRYEEEHGEIELEYE